MSKRFEDFIKNNWEEFDEIEPSVDLWAKIEQSLNMPEELPRMFGRHYRQPSPDCVLINRRCC